MAHKPLNGIINTGSCSPTTKKRKLHRQSSRVKMSSGVDDVRIDRLQPVLPPACLLDELPMNDTLSESIVGYRRDVANIIAGTDDRLLVVCGPCSIHDVAMGREYALKLRELRQELKGELCVVMRVYFEKPRTTIGWKGLINDPDLDGSFNINKGIRLARKLLLDINELGLPCGVEFLDTISPQFIADTVSWGAIGARTTESQVHRELASGLSMPIGFKNGTSGEVQPGIDAVRAARHPHSFLSVTKQGLVAIVHTKGNHSAHIILRGGRSGTNYDATSIEAVEKLCVKAGVEARLVVDCSHGNSQKIHTNQPVVASSIAQQIAGGCRRLVGVMIESNLVEGKQKLTIGTTLKTQLKYGQSVTDACINMDTTATVLRELATAVKARRAKAAQNESK